VNHEYCRRVLLADRSIGANTNSLVGPAAIVHWIHSAPTGSADGCALNRITVTYFCSDATDMGTFRALAIGGLFT
jgi:hypothetical protein